MGMLGRQLTRRRRSSTRRPTSSDTDDRPLHATEVLDRAGKLLGKPVSMAVLDALNAADVLYDWQLIRLNDADFERLGCSVGLKTAIRQTLAANGTQSRGRPISEMPPELRRFLLVPEPDGSLPPRLHAMSCLFYSVVLQDSPRETQGVCFALGEVFAVMAGLTLAIPLSLRTGEDLTEWQETPTVAMAIEITSALAISTLMLCTIVSCCCALFSQFDAGIPKENTVLHLRVVSIIGQSGFWWSMSINLLMVVITLHTYHATGILAAAAAVLIVLFLGSALILDVMIRRIIAPCFPLEMLHLPRWWRVMISVMAPSASCAMLGDLDAKYLDKAQARAARLLRRAGFDPRTVGFEEPQQACALAAPMAEATPSTTTAMVGRVVV